MRFDVVLTPHDGGDPIDVPVDTGDIYQWEKRNRGKTVQQLTENMSMVDLYAVAHIAARRRGLVDVRNADELADGYTIELAEPAEPDPTPRGRSREQ